MRLKNKIALEFTPSAPGFLINGLKREQLIATNSTVLHELFSTGLVTRAS